MSDTTPPAFSFPGCEMITDSRGRQLFVKKLSITEELDLLEVAAENADNRRWYGLVSLACVVRAIDGMPEAPPTSRAWLRNRVKSVGAEGIAAVMAWLTKDDVPADGDAPPGERLAATPSSPQPSA